MNETAPLVEPPRPGHTPGMPLGQLAELLGAELRPSDGGPEREQALTGVTLDSRAVMPGDLWCALPGARAHGAQFAAQAAERGARAALTDETGADACTAAGMSALVVADPRALTARAAAGILGRPSEAMTVVGVTGTNGKTSVTTMLHLTLMELGRTSGVIGTSGTAFTDAEGREHQIRTVRTTPEAPEVQGILARMRECGVTQVAMEISSHALVLHRADDIDVDVAVFTNLSQDHLDFHADMEDYFAAKASLFTPAHARRGIVCVDDAWGQRLAREAPIDVTTYTTRADIDADHRVISMEPGADGGIGTMLVCRSREGREVTLTSPLPGRHYVANTVAVALVLEAIGIDVTTAAPAIAHAAVVPGRMENVGADGIRGIVDYSHTEDALIQALSTLRALPDCGRLLVVMGAGGDRDTTKRPRMGAAAADLADVVIVTDDNPRSEDPAEIRRAVLAGIGASPRAEVHERAGRGEAIALAARLAQPGDTVLVAGKGAETGQDIGGVIHPFDDRIRLREALARAAQEGPSC